MSIFSIINNLIKRKKNIILSNLPTQGYFYPSDFSIRIKKADVLDIIEYEFNYDNEKVNVIIESIKKVVSKNIIFTNNYGFNDIKSVDIVFIFLEIVKFTMNKNIRIPFLNRRTGKYESVDFGPNNFNYYDFSNYEHDEDTREIIIDGYRVTMPSVGVENCLSGFLSERVKEHEVWLKYKYDFLFFIGNKNHLSVKEIENLVEIFNYDIDEKEIVKIEKIVLKILDVVGYKLKSNDQIVDIKPELDLKKIWKV